ncbi:MAG: bifunctional UDP-3-O-[3-hydroxymyristoyl] N-acetylglucosamine deacetylase/3-hydroxyacyl-ACP dehydratase [Bacteroidota bacterium]|nr:bifunctional UDP-3-O-[3-hydroxymyristoyl] N-acetylglucosamine deacetylase/3-hydroxyacyl-ACP dehydratase [Bacteroidota bacterium]
MSDKQTTLAQAVTLSGKGLHTGYEVQIIFNPAPENHGYKFQRIDLEGQPIISASVANVTETSRGTTLEEKGVKLHTIEHALSALNGLQLDNVLIQMNGPEAPILDGSSKHIVEAILEAGIEEQYANRQYFELSKKIVYKDEENNIEIIAYPDDHFSANVLIDYNSKVVGNQYASLNTKTNYAKEIAPCRTFVFFHELEFLLKNNLIKGGDLENAIVIMENKVEQSELDRIADLFNKPHIAVKPEGYLNNLDLRYGNEIARHKLLDLIGDIALVGMPIKAKIVATRPGHYANTQFAALIQKQLKKEIGKAHIPKYDNTAKPLYDINQIKNILPHRPPFLLVDKILEMTDTMVIGMKNVTMNEGFFVGHFPNEPIMPGVLQIEAMAQAGGILVLNTVDNPKDYLTYFLKVDKVRFKQKVVPGDTLIFKLELITPIRRGIALMFGQAFVGDKVVMEGELMAQIAKAK